MAIEYRNEQFIQQYEHITKLSLLTDEELVSLKRKRNFFEISIRTATEVKPYIDYIKFEIALMRKFRNLEYEDDNDARALDNAIAYHIKNLFRFTLKRFQEKRKIWEHYLSFVKQRLHNSVPHVYREMLRYHHTADDYIEAAEFEISRNNYTHAMTLLSQGMGDNKDSCARLVVVYIECSLKQGENEGKETKKATLLQASKFYDKFLKDSNDLPSICELLRRAQPFEYSKSFQNDVIKQVLESHGDRAEVWEVLASRHLEGLIYEEPSSTGDENEIEENEDSIKVPFGDCLRHTVTIYEKSLEIVQDFEKQKMFTFYINRLLALDELESINSSCLKLVRRSLGKALSTGFKQEKLSEDHFICLLKLRMVQMERFADDIAQMIVTGLDLYPTSLVICELAVKFYLQSKNYEKITGILKVAVVKNEKHAIEIYRFICALYLFDDGDKVKALNTMREAVHSGDKKLSEAFQPYFLESIALTESIDKARETFKTLLSSKTLNSLSLEFFRMMIKLENSQEAPNMKTIRNCYERASEHFGRDSPEVSCKNLS